MRLAIVEDDDKVRQQLQTYVLQYFQGRENDVEIRLFADGDEILEDYAADYDLIFLDIQMKRLDGLATAERIRERDEDVYLVFITNLANYAIRGYAVHALDFILKPVNFLMLRQVLMSVERLLDQKPKRYITLPTDTGLTRLDVSQITYVETDGHAVSIYTEKGGVSPAAEYARDGGAAWQIRIFPLQQLLFGESAACGARGEWRRHRRRAGADHLTPAP